MRRNLSNFLPVSLWQQHPLLRMQGVPTQLLWPDCGLSQDTNLGSEYPPRGGLSIKVKGTDEGCWFHPQLNLILSQGISRSHCSVSLSLHLMLDSQLGLPGNMGRPSPMPSRVQTNFTIIFRIKIFPRFSIWSLTQPGMLGFCLTTSFLNSATAAA